MHLQRRQRCDPDAGASLVGRKVRADPATADRPIVGTVVEADGYMVSVKVSHKLIVVVDMEDCHPLTGQ